MGRKNLWLLLGQIQSINVEAIPPSPSRKNTLVLAAVVQLSFATSTNASHPPYSDSRSGA